MEIGNLSGSKSFKEHHHEILKVLRKPRGAEDSAYVELANSINLDTISGNVPASVFESYDYGYGSSYTASADRISIGYYSARYGLENDVELATLYYVDNFRIYDTAYIAKSA